MNGFRIADVSDAVFALLRRANKYIDETTPWVLAKDDASMTRLGTVLYNLLETIRVGAILLEPFMPLTSASILNCLATDIRSLDSLNTFGRLKPGTVVGEAKPLFARIDDVKLLAEIETERAAAAAKAEAEAKSKEKPEGCAVIGIDDFMKVELRTAKVLSCETVPKAKKLLKLQLDLGYEKRQVVSGIAKFYKPEELVGKKLIVVANLAPATLCGVESQGMILASGEEQVRVVFLDPETQLGERVR
jgi:methionyl-tRNA synthetase